MKNFNFLFRIGSRINVAVSDLLDRTPFCFVPDLGYGNCHDRVHYHSREIKFSLSNQMPVADFLDFAVAESLYMVFCFESPTGY